MKAPLLAACLLLCSVPLAATTPVDSPDIQEGVRLWKDGDLEGALLQLDSAVRARKGDSSRSSELALAHFYMGVVYVSLGQESLGQSRFEDALALGPDLKADPGEHAAKTLRVFEAAKKAYADRLILERDARKKRGKGPWLLVGLGAAAAGGIAVAVAPHERANQPPTASFQFEPAGEAIVNVTQVGFTASATDPEGEPLVYAWVFGDGGAASGSSATHVFTREGIVSVVLTVRDGLASTEARRDIPVRSLAGTWQISPPLFTGDSGVTLTQQGTFLASPFMNCGPAGRGYSDHGEISSPRSVLLIFSAVGSVACGACEYRFVGNVDPALRVMTGTLSCTDFRGGCPCAGQQITATLSRS